MEKSSTPFVGMDVHKKSIDIAIADTKEARHYGRIGGDAVSVDREIRKLRSVHKKPLFIYEAGPCEFLLYRKLAAQGLPCMVVSPLLTPRNAANRVKTDRRNAMKLTRLARAGELQPIYGPDALDECDTGSGLRTRTRWRCSARHGRDCRHREASTRLSFVGYKCESDRMSASDRQSPFRPRFSP